jgi:hypothetical protein
MTGLSEGRASSGHLGACSYANGATRGAAVELVKHVGVSLRDAGELLGLSQERVRPLTAA